MPNDSQMRPERLAVALRQVRVALDQPGQHGAARRVDDRARVQIVAMRLDARDAVALDDDVDVLARPRRSRRRTVARRARSSSRSVAVGVHEKRGVMSRTLPSTTSTSRKPIGRPDRGAGANRAVHDGELASSVRQPARRTGRRAVARRPGTRPGARRRSPPSACRPATRPGRSPRACRSTCAAPGRTSGRGEASLPRRRSSDATRSTWLVPSRKRVEYGRSADITTARPSGDQLGRPGSFKPIVRLPHLARSRRRRPAAAIRDRERRCRVPSGDHAAAIAARRELAVARRSRRSRIHKSIDAVAIGRERELRAVGRPRRIGLDERVAGQALAASASPPVAGTSHRSPSAAKATCVPSGEIAGCIRPRTGCGPSRRKRAPLGRERRPRERRRPPRTAIVRAGAAGGRAPLDLAVGGVEQLARPATPLRPEREHVLVGVGDVRAADDRAG